MRKTVITAALAAAMVLIPGAGIAAADPYSDGWVSGSAALSADLGAVAVRFLAPWFEIPEPALDPF